MRSLVLIKPDAWQHKLVGWLIACFEKFQIDDLGHFNVYPQLCREHYQPHIDKPFYPGLEAFMCSGSTLAMHVTGHLDAIRQTALEARRHFKDLVSGPRNLVHASDSLLEAERELDIWFPYRPVRWHPMTKVVQDWETGTVDLDATHAIRVVKGLPVPWTSEVAEREVHQKPVH